MKIKLPRRRRERVTPTTTHEFTLVEASIFVYHDLVDRGLKPHQAWDRVSKLVDHQLVTIVMQDEAHR